MSTRQAEVKTTEPLYPNVVFAEKNPPFDDSFSAWVRRGFSIAFGTCLFWIFASVAVGALAMVALAIAGALER